MTYTIESAVSTPIMEGDSPIYHIVSTKTLPPPVVTCHNLPGTPCPEGKTSYWRNFAMNLRTGGCGDAKKVCGTEPWPTVGPPHYVLQPASKEELIKFL